MIINFLDCNSNHENDWTWTSTNSQDAKVGSSGVKVSSLGTFGALGRFGVLMARRRAFKAAALPPPCLGTPLPWKTPSKSDCHDIKGLWRETDGLNPSIHLCASTGQTPLSSVGIKRQSLWSSVTFAAGVQQRWLFGPRVDHQPRTFDLTTTTMAAAVDLNRNGTSALRRKSSTRIRATPKSILISLDSVTIKDTLSGPTGDTKVVPCSYCSIPAHVDCSLTIGALRTVTCPSR